MTSRIVDPVIEEMRDIRKGIVAVCAEQHEDYFAHLIAVQDSYRDRTVSFVQMPVDEQLKCSAARTNR